MTNSYDYEDEETKQYQICFFSNWLLGDHLGSTSMTTDASGVVVSELRYSTFGETRYQNGTLTTDYLYTGQRQEAEIGLYYFVARWYDPAIGRFLQADSIVPNPASAKGFDRYAYGFNNPLLYLDPSGHVPLLLDGMQTVYQDFSYSSHVSKENVENTNNWHEKPDKDVKFPDKNYNHQKDKNALSETTSNTHPQSSEEAANLYGPCFTCHANKESNHWLSYEEMEFLQQEMWQQEAIGYSLLVVPSLVIGGADIMSLGGGATYVIGKYNELRKLAQGTGLQVHHIIEQRFAPLLGSNPLNWPSVVLSPEEHQAITNAWRALIPYSNSASNLNTNTATVQDVWNAALQIYSSYPQLLEQARITLFGP